MDRKQIVKLGISSAMILVGAYFLASTKNNKIESVPQQTQLRSQKKEIKKETSKKEISQKEFVLEVKRKECRSLFTRLTPLMKSAPKSWSNYYLERSGIDYVLRLVKSSNNQGLEVEKVQFYQLDEDGFPTPYSDYHDTVLLDKSELNKMMKGFKRVSRRDVAQVDDYLVEAEDGKIDSIKNQQTQDQCTFP